MKSEELLQAAKDACFDRAVEMVYVCESGSRAWGFASSDSDYDVRFFFKQPVMEYVRIGTPVEYLQKTSGVLDVVGWDIRKALGLLRKSNCSAVEWLFSPVVYREYSAYINQLRNVMREGADLTAMQHHYRGMAMKHVKRYLVSDRVSLKKYLYILRGLMCCHWMRLYQTIPPVWVPDLEALYPPGFQELLDLKKGRTSEGPSRETSEKDTMRRNPDLDRYIGEQLAIEPVRFQYHDLCGPLNEILEAELMRGRDGLI